MLCATIGSCINPYPSGYIFFNFGKNNRTFRITKGGPWKTWQNIRTSVLFGGGKFLYVLKNIYPAGVSPEHFLDGGDVFQHPCIGGGAPPSPC